MTLRIDRGQTKTHRHRLASAVTRYPSVPYVLPFVLFLALTIVQTGFSEAVVWMYPLKTALVAACLMALWPWFPPLIPGHLILSTLVGLAVFIAWILPEGLYPYLGTPEAFDPHSHFAGTALYGWMALRLAGATLVVPIMEELFWRGFILRWIVARDFRKVPIGTFTWPSFLLTSLLFATEHNRWLVGLVAGIVYNLLLYRTRSLFACMVAHGVTNLALGVYVLNTGLWTFW